MAQSFSNTVNNNNRFGFKLGQNVPRKPSTSILPSQLRNNNRTGGQYSASNPSALTNIMLGQNNPNTKLNTNVTNPAAPVSKAWKDVGKTIKVNEPNKGITTGAAPLVNTPQTTQAGTGTAGIVSSPAAAAGTTPVPAQTTTESEKGGRIKADGTRETGTRGLFPDVLSSLRNLANPTADQKRLLRKLEADAERSRSVAQKAEDISTKYGEEIARVGQLGAGAVAGNLSTGTNVVGAGNAAIASQSASSRMQALAAGQQAELAGTQQGLTAAEQEAAATGQALSSANVQQQQGASALSSVAGYAQPSPAGYGQTVFNPVTGQYEGGQPGLDPANVAQQLAQAVRSGQMTYEQAVSSLGYSGAGQQFLNQALGPGFNPSLASATMAGQANVIGQLPQLQAAEVAAEGIKDKISTYLSANPQLNPSDAALVNQFNNWIQGKQLTDPKFQTLFTYLNEYTNTLAPILGVGGDPTNLKTEIAASFINPRAGAPSIVEVMNNLSSLSKGKLQDMQSGAMGGSTVSSPQSYGTGGGGIFDW